MLKLQSREYKVPLHVGVNTDELWSELNRVAGEFGIPATGIFEPRPARLVWFLDTADQLLDQANLVIRVRQSSKRFQFTLKCRTEDRYVAANRAIRARRRYHGRSKFEQDIAPPFRLRFSHSVSIRRPVSRRVPKTLGDLAKWFPILSTFPAESTLQRVRDVTANEVVLRGGILKLIDRKAEVAIIQWSDPETDQPLVAECSFRYRDKKERYSAALAAQARDFFEAIQGLSQCDPAGSTKTQFIYGRAGQARV